MPFNRFYCRKAHPEQEEEFMNRVAALFALMVVVSWSMADAQARAPRNSPGKNLVELKVKYQTDTERPTATGIVVSPTRVITVYHAVSLGEVISTKDNKKAKVVAADPQHDILVLEFEGEPFKDVIPPKVGPDLKLRDYIECWGNAMSRGPILRPFTVVKVENDFVVVSPSFIHGESGAGCYNYKEELVGIVSRSFRHENDPGLALENVNDELGTLTPIKFFLQYIPPPKVEIKK